MTRRAATPRVRRSPQRRAATNLEQAGYQRIIDALIEQRLPPGTQLKEEQLGRLFGISRTRVRKVLGRLSAEGVVTLEPNRGAFVAQPAIGEARDVFEARRAVEACIVKSLGARGPRMDLARLRQFIPAEREAFRSRLPGLSRFASDFHLILAELAGNEILVSILRQLLHRCHLIQSLYGPVPMVELVDDHTDLIQLIADGKADDATQLMLDHLMRVEASLDLSNVREAKDLSQIL